MMPTFFQHKVSGQMIKVAATWIHGEENFIIFDDFWTLKDLEQKGWRRVEEEAKNFLSLSRSQVEYISKQIKKIESFPPGKNSRKAALDCKWRIASCAEVNHNPNGTLTPKQEGFVDNFIKAFKFRYWRQK